MNIDTYLDVNKRARVDYFGWALNLCLLANGSGFFLDLLNEDGIIPKLSLDEQLLLGQGLEKMARSRVHKFGTVSILPCNELTSSENLYIAVKHGLRMNDTFEHFIRRPQHHHHHHHTETIERTFPFSPHLLIIQDIDCASKRTQASITEMLLYRKLSPPSGGLGLIEYLELPPYFLIIATSTRLPQPCSTTTLSSFFSSSVLSDRLLSGFLFRIPLILANTTTSLVEKPVLVTPQFSKEDFIKLLPLMSTIYISPLLIKQIRLIISALHEHPRVKIGPSPKTMEFVLLALKAQAAMRNSTFVTPSDFSQVMIESLAHRFQVLELSKTTSHPIHEAREIVAAVILLLPAV